MGKIKFSFSLGGNIVNNFDDFDTARFFQHYHKNYPLNGIEKLIEFEGNDVIFDIDLNTFDDNSWDKLAYPTDEVRKTLYQLLGYQKLLIELLEIDQKIRVYDLNNSPFELSNLADKAKNIINSLPESNLLTDCLFIKDLSIKNLDHTINQELNIYLSHNARDSQKRRAESLRHA